MIVATTIMGVAVTGLLAGLSGATRNAARLRDYDRVVQLARLRMNELLLDERLPRDTVVSGEFDPAPGRRCVEKTYSIEPQITRINADCDCVLGSARASRAMFRHLVEHLRFSSGKQKFAMARRHRQHARRVLYPIHSRRGRR